MNPMGYSEYVDQAKIGGTDLLPEHWWNQWCSEQERTWFGGRLQESDRREVITYGLAKPWKQLIPRKQQDLLSAMKGKTRMNESKNTTPTVSDFMLRYEQESRDRKARAKETLLALVPKLKENGVTALFGFFDGSGDSGQIEEVRIVRDADPDTTLRQQYEMSEAIPEDDAFVASLGDLEDVLWDLTPDRFENNEGGFGAVVILVNENKLRLNYSFRVEETQEADEEL